MGIRGTVYLVNDTTSFFLPLVLEVGGSAPTTGFELCNSPLVATLTIQLGGFLGDIGIEPAFVTNVNTANSTFEFNLPNLEGLDPQYAALSLTLHNYPIYRSGFFPHANLGQDLNIYLYQPTLPTSDGISAGQVSGALSSSSLPGNTFIVATPSGLNIAASEGQINLDFGIAIIPDTSHNLDLYFDLLLNGYNIHVGWPEDWCESPDDVLNSIKSGLQTAGSAANNVVQSQLMTILQAAPLNLSSLGASNLLQNISIQFGYVGLHDCDLSGADSGLPARLLVTHLTQPSYLLASLGHDGINPIARWCLASSVLADTPGLRGASARTDRAVGQ